MKRSTLLWWLLGSAGLYWLWRSRQTSGSDAAGFLTAPVTYMSEAVQSAVSGWKNAGQGPVWVPVLNAVEQAKGLPADLLARIAYQESRFREDIIRGDTTSSAGALGIMQLMPQYFASVRVSRPFSDDAVNSQIAEAAALLLSLHGTFGDWSLAIAAYNDGAGNVEKYLQGTRDLPVETTNYVAQVTADVPSLSA